jgi:hypothetical protein
LLVGVAGFVVACSGGEDVPISHGAATSTSSRSERPSITTTTEAPSGLDFPVDLATALEHTLDRGVHFEVSFDGSYMLDGAQQEGVSPDFLKGVGFTHLTGDAIGDRVVYGVEDPRPAVDVFGEPFTALDVLIDGETCWGGGVEETSQLVPRSADDDVRWICFDPTDEPEIVLGLVAWEIPFYDGVPLVSGLIASPELDDLSIGAPGRASFEVTYNVFRPPVALGGYEQLLRPLLDFTEGVGEAPLRLTTTILPDGRVERIEARLEFADFLARLDVIGEELGVPPEERGDAGNRIDQEGHVDFILAFSEHDKPPSVFEDRIDRMAEGDRVGIERGLRRVGEVVLAAFLDSDG